MKTDGQAEKTMDADLRTLIADLVAIIDGSIRHDYQGNCPDELLPSIRDPDCPACRVLLRAQALLTAALTLPGSQECPEKAS